MNKMTHDNFVVDNIYDFLFKILIVGDINTGKTAILDQFANGHFDGSYISTIGIDFNVKIIPVENNGKVKLQVWDTCGQERFRALTRSYYRNASAVVIVYDITNRNTFEKAKIWIKEIEDYVDSNVLRVLVGNKSDLYPDRKIEYFEGHSFAEKNYMEFFETSAKYDNNIETLFKFIADKLNSSSLNKNKTSKPSSERKNKCC